MFIHSSSCFVYKKRFETPLTDLLAGAWIIFINYNGIMYTLLFSMCDTRCFTRKVAIDILIFLHRFSRVERGFPFIFKWKFQVQHTCQKFSLVWPQNSKTDRSFISVPDSSVSELVNSLLRCSYYYFKWLCKSCLWRNKCLSVAWERNL